MKENEEEILNFTNGVLLSKAENKFLFIAFCFEYRNYYNNLVLGKSFYYSNFPIQLDATCNGYQHLAMLIEDENLLNLLNLDESN